MTLSSSPQAPAPRKRLYRAPTLLVYGSVARITGGAVGAITGYCSSSSHSRGKGQCQQAPTADS